ncbi:MAG: hypothetical protein P9X24_17055 [Candidatus Hatepunaea meridiana]|nr:hypothetical protein [Candidatus Hatepunaea meridiana]
MRLDLNTAVKNAEQGINNYLDSAFKEDMIDRQSYLIAKQDTLKKLKEWLFDTKIDEISPNLKGAILDAIHKQRWEDIVNAFRKEMNFGTGGIRGLMATYKEAIIKLKEDGIDAEILKGPNTLNNVVLLKTSAGVAKYGRDRGFNKIVIGYDSRVRGYDFSKTIAELFLAYDYTVYLFDDPCPYPEVTYAIPYERIKAHLGILISASHNDYRYNGYKLSCGNGSQFDPEQRNEMYFDYILKATTDDIKLQQISETPKGKIIFLGGDKILDNFDYMGHEDSLFNIHEAHREHVKSFLLQKQESGNKIGIGYCAFHGSGRIAVPRLLRDIGFDDLKIITHQGLNELDGMFPSFNSDPGREQQPDPGDPRAAVIEKTGFDYDFPGKWEETEILLGTDPDADRVGTVVHVPENQRHLYNNRDYLLLPADDMWALLLWFRLEFDKSIDPEKTFITLSHTTSDSIVKIALKNGIGVVKTWVGFGNLSAAVRETWDNKIQDDKYENLYEGRLNPQDELCNMFIQETNSMNNGKRIYNLGALEQSNGFSILGYPPKDEFSLGEKGHVRDKDGTFAAILIAEIAEWAKKNNTSLFELIDEKVYLDPEVGLFVNHYEPDPLDGEYPGIQGDRTKKAILRRALGYYQLALAGGLEIAGHPVKSAVIYRTGKYDILYPRTYDFIFPDEGIRFYFDDERLSHLTIRPSGTTNSLRFHIQLHSDVNRDNLVEKKQELHKRALQITDQIRVMLDAPRSSVLG